MRTLNPHYWYSEKRREREIIRVRKYKKENNRGKIQKKKKKKKEGKKKVQPVVSHSLQLSFHSVAFSYVLNKSLDSFVKGCPPGCPGGGSPKEKNEGAEVWRTSTKRTTQKKKKRKKKRRDSEKDRFQFDKVIRFLYINDVLNLDNFVG